MPNRSRTTLPAGPKNEKPIPFPFCSRKIFISISILYFYINFAIPFFMISFFPLFTVTVLMPSGNEEVKKSIFQFHCLRMGSNVLLLFVEPTKGREDRTKKNCRKQCAVCVLFLLFFVFFIS